jgi:hypothetical protein
VDHEKRFIVSYLFATVRIPEKNPSRLISLVSRSPDFNARKFHNFVLTSVTG